MKTYLFLFVFGLCTNRVASYGELLSQFATDVGPNRETDLVVMLDRSQGMGRTNFYNTEKGLVSAMLRQYAVLHPDFTRLAIITLARDVEIPVDYISSDHTSNTKGNIFYSIPAPFDDLIYNTNSTVASGTHLDLAFSTAQTIFDAGQAERSGAARVMFVLTDGAYNSDEDPHDTMNAMKAAGVHIYTCGLGAWLRHGNVRELATSPEYYAEEDGYVNLISSVSRSWQADTLPVWYGPIDSALCGGACSLGECFTDGLTGRSECRCQPGYFEGVNGCEVCGWHMYKSDYGNEVCTPCPSEYTTIQMGSTSRDQCMCGEFAPSCVQSNIELDPCITQGCNSHQMCVNYATFAQCICMEGFTGFTCDDNTDDCTANPCQNGGTCLDGVNEATCVCPSGFMGDLCEINIDDCGPPVCDNGAVCIDYINSFHCNCSNIEFEGYHCQEAIVPPTSPAVTEGYDNTTSGGSAVVYSSGLSTFWIIVIASVTGVVILIFLIVCVVCVVSADRRRKDAVNDATLARSELARAKREREGKSSVRRYRKTLTKTLSQAFAGFWKRKTVRGSMYVEENGYGGTPSAPPKQRPDILSGEAPNYVDEMVLTEQGTKIDGSVTEGPMEGWVSYLRDLKFSDVILSGVICDIDSQKNAMTSDYIYDNNEIEDLHNALLNNRREDVITIQNNDFYISDNDNTILHANTVASSSSLEVCYIGRTRTFLIILIGADDGAKSIHIRKELQWIMDHIAGEGY